MTENTTYQYSEQTKNDLKNVLHKAINHLLSSRNLDNWGAAKATSMAIWALGEVASLARDDKESQDGSINYSKNLKHVEQVVHLANNWLCKQKIDENNDISWESEEWDTSVAIFALWQSRNDRNIIVNYIRPAIAWIKHRQDIDKGKVKGTWSWGEDSWETTLSLNAMILVAGEDEHVKSEQHPAIINGLKWFNSIPSSDLESNQGMYLSPLYSAFLVWLNAEYQMAYPEDLDQTASKFSQKAQQASEYLVERKFRESETAPWSNNTWINSYAIYALVKSGAYENNISFDKITKWYKNKQHEDGSFEDTEDTSLAVIGIAHLCIKLDISIAEIFNKEFFTQPEIRCFLGYSTKSQEIGTIVKSELNTSGLVKVCDWGTDFKIGDNLFEEISNVVKECALSVFIFARDDVRHKDTIGEKEEWVPRDNVLFEAGLMIGKTDTTRTCILVQEGAVKPSDLNGIIHKSFKSLDDTEYVRKATKEIIDHIRKLILGTDQVPE
jgi:predicted nucleotide-binding protein